MNRCKLTELKILTEWAADGNSESEDEIDALEHIQASTNQSPSSPTGLHQPVRGLQIALNESWIGCRGRETCSFTHDRYREAVEIEIQSRPSEYIAKVSLKVLILFGFPAFGLSYVRRSS